MLLMKINNCGKRKSLPFKLLPGKAANRFYIFYIYSHVFIGAKLYIHLAFILPLHFFNKHLQLLLIDPFIGYNQGIKDYNL